MMAAAVLLILVTAVQTVKGSSEVMESNSTYSCCGRWTVPYNPTCDNTWTIGDKTFAYSTSGGVNNACSSPCKKIAGGEMMLDRCVDVNVTVACQTMKVIVEKRIYYLSQMCPESLSKTAGDQGRYAGSLLLVLVITASFMKEMIC